MSAKALASHPVAEMAEDLAEEEEEAEVHKDRDTHIKGVHTVLSIVPAATCRAAAR
jgi:hypothetical protein